ncbi:MULTISPECIES: hypothetical protein [Streptomyces]|uniref:Uncharacterized protein n=1 Tax=Streptomyces tsukubensis (strain DSM 42081 / NBRC 108919 / NRRL 18488 / 9993) TaxID=1114943 RepID=I2N0X0_STRT9|nr:MULTISPECIES: hypothetical protein [Streptomyces]AZK94848.1 hypothetical protein B7R87_13960 [Streptomyces tsukubensis]EIF90667.1 hypothetical protein [Streptomyces tsukubensis NRRL18488]MYS66982.1 hypothetical protein [Streptomyces sp. SID5473]QKM69069.1 hypothetical protein STSU_019810 [Streptomyces tsukubensis NRRL18488]TAI40708.1 hypothetical protein EWI31_30425 [Streptomyces tsukubensis]
MSTRDPRPSLKSITSSPGGPRPAEPAPASEGRSAPKGVAEGVPSALLPDPHPATDGRRIVGGLRVTAPRGTDPTATSWCACGRDRSAIGHRRVLALIDDHTHHRTVCPHQHPQEGRAAA